MTTEGTIFIPVTKHKAFSHQVCFLEIISFNAHIMLTKLCSAAS